VPKVQTSSHSKVALQSFECKSEGLKVKPRVAGELFGFSPFHETFDTKVSLGLEQTVSSLQNQSLRQNLKNTLGLRKIIKKNSNLYPTKLVGALGTDLEPREPSRLTPNSIKRLQLKRFTEAFYITYRNLHLIPRFTIHMARLKGKKGHASPRVQSVTRHNVEKNIKPIYEKIGYNQSLFMLWPVAPLLKIKP